MLLLHNIHVVDSDITWVAFDSDITAVGSGQTWQDHTSGAEVIDGAGGYLSRPFIETHSHGLKGASAEEGISQLRQIRHEQSSFGVGSSILSLVSLELTQLLSLIDDARFLADQDPGFLGLHLEGPFISLERSGAHDRSAIRSATHAELEQLIARGIHGDRQLIASMTLAPEEFDAQSLAMLRDAGIQLCLGHTEANYEQSMEFFSSFGRILTHAFNAMPPIGHRAPGPIPAALDSGAFTELIADGHHVLPSVARLLDKDRVILVTDSMSAAGMGDGDYALGSLRVSVRDGVARTASGALAGSTLTMNEAVANFALWHDDPAAAIRAATSNPTSAYGIEVGEIAPGETAELLLLDAKAKLVRSFNL